MVRIRRFSVIRTANTVALMYVIAIAIVAIPLMLLFLVAPPPRGSGGPNIGFVAAPIFAIVIAVFYGLASWVFTALACLVYNLTSRFTGGIGMELMTEWVPATAPAAPAATPGGTSSAIAPPQP